MDGFSFSVNLNVGFSFFCSSLILLLLLLLLLLPLSFLPSLFGRVEPLLEELKGLVSLSPAQGGIRIPDLKRESSEQFNASLDIIALHVNSIVTQSSTIPARELMEERKREINAQRSAAAKSRIDRIEELLSPDLLKAAQETRDKGASSWLNAIPIEEHGLPLNKQKFRDSLQLPLLRSFSI